MPMNNNIKYNTKVYTIERQRHKSMTETKKEKIEFFQLINKHIVEDEKPSKFFNNLNATDLINEYPFSMISKLKKTEQSPKYHPEGNVWNHTMLVIDEAAKVKRKSSDHRAFMWAALLHDIGKPDTTRNRKGKITSYDHDKVGAILAKEFLEYFTDDEIFIQKVVNLVFYHMHILYVVKNLAFSDIKEMKKKVKTTDIALLGLCDRLGRLNVDRKLEEENIKNFIKKCSIEK